MNFDVMVEKAVGYMGDPPADDNDFTNNTLYHGKGRRARKNGKCQGLSIFKVSPSASSKFPVAKFPLDFHASKC